MPRPETFNRKTKSSVGEKYLKKIDTVQKLYDEAVATSNDERLMIVGHTIDAAKAQLRAAMRTRDVKTNRFTTVSFFVEQAYEMMGLIRGEDVMFDEDENPWEELDPSIIAIDRAATYERDIDDEIYS